MSLTSPDTTPEAARALVRGLRARDAGAKAADRRPTAPHGPDLAETGVRRRRPDLPAEGVRREVARKMLGAETFSTYAAAVGWSEP